MCVAVVVSVVVFDQVYVPWVFVAELEFVSVDRGFDEETALCVEENGQVCE